jgi:HD-GYP domain-containing protein (c-di-GMP phosphodiesterase class II)
MFVESLLNRLMEELMGNDPPAMLDYWVGDITRLDLQLDYEHLIGTLFQAYVPAVREHMGDAQASPLFGRADVLLRIAKHKKQPEAAIADAEISAAIDAAEAMLGMAQLRDPALAAQARAVSHLAQQLAGLVEMSDSEVRLAKVAGLVYDLGKLGVADVLACEGPFTSEQFVHMQRHAADGAALVANVPTLAGLKLPAIVRAHHERYDGFGYPDRLAGSTIPAVSRVLAVADAYFAMTSVRPYRPAMSIEEVLQTLEEGAGNQWDPLVVKAVDRAVRQGPRRQPQRLRSVG